MSGEDGRRRSKDEEPQPYDGSSPTYVTKKSSKGKVLAAFAVLLIVLLVVQTCA